MFHSHRDEQEVEATVHSYSNMLFRLCFSFFGNTADAEDATQETMLKYLTSAPPFRDDEHKKAWLLRVASNICKDMLRHRKHEITLNTEDIQGYCSKDDLSADIISEVLRLPWKYRIVIHLFYVEGYKTNEIASLLSVSPAAVRKRLQYGRERLRINYKKEGIL